MLRWLLHSLPERGDTLSALWWVSGSIVFWCAKWLFKEFWHSSEIYWIWFSLLHRLAEFSSVRPGRTRSNSGRIHWNLHNGSLMNQFQVEPRFTLLLSHRGIQASRFVCCCMCISSCLSTKITWHSKTIQEILKGTRFSRPILDINHSYIHLGRT